MARQKLPATAVAVGLALFTTGEHAIAQGASELEVRMEAGSRATSSLIPSAGMALAPSVRYARPNFTLNARTSAWQYGTAWVAGDARIASELSTASFHGLRGEVLGSVNREVASVSAVANYADLSGRLHLIRENNGAWLGAGAIQPLRVAQVSNASVRSGGVWTRLRDLTLRASVTNVQFTKFATNDTALGGSGVAPCDEVTTSSSLPLESGSCRKESRLTDFEGGVRWEHQRFEFGLRGGQRFGKAMDITDEFSRTWSSAHAALWVTSQLAVVGATGTEPAQPTRGLPGRRFVSGGVMLAYWPIPHNAVLVESALSKIRLFEFRSAGPSLQRLTARIGGVEKVEIMGDFTDWAPVQLVRRGRDVWELLVPMPAGVHQVNMRIDGGKWFAPPGIPSTRDDFNGEVGVLVIKQ